MATAALVLWTIAAIQILARPTPHLSSALRNPRALLLTAGGAFCGPFLGVWLSLVAVRWATIGVATTIMSIVPILVIPWMFLIYREKPRLMELIGAGIAIAGVGLLFAL